MYRNQQQQQSHNKNIGDYRTLSSVRRRGCRRGRDSCESTSRNTTMRSKSLKSSAFLVLCCIILASHAFVHKNGICKQRIKKLPTSTVFQTNVSSAGETTTATKTKSPSSPPSDDGSASTAATIAAVNNSSPTKRRNSRQPRNWERRSWRANFHVSVETQKRIRKAFETFKGAESNLRSQRVLQEFLSTPPAHCNVVNLVGALTMSAKALPTRKVRHDEQFRLLLFQTLEVLNVLVKMRFLDFRHLCNAGWAIAMHYEKDAAVLPQWNEKDEVRQAQQLMVLETINLMTDQITSMLQDPETAKGGIPKVGEICMASLSYGKLFRKGDQSTTSEEGTVATATENDSSATEKNDMERSTMPVVSIDKFYDAIASALCRFDDESSEEAAATSAGVDKTRVYNRPISSVGVSQCTWNELSNVAWSFATHEQHSSGQAETLLLRLSNEARRRLQEGGPALKSLRRNDLVRMVWALGTLNVGNPRLNEAFVSLIKAWWEQIQSEFVTNNSIDGSDSSEERPLRNWECADILQVTTALARAGLAELPFLQALYNESYHRLARTFVGPNGRPSRRYSFKLQELTTMLRMMDSLKLGEEQWSQFKEFASAAENELIKNGKDVPKKYPIRTIKANEDGDNEKKSAEKKKRSNEHQHLEPWKASFKLSIRTQGKIKKAFNEFRSAQPTLRAKKVLQAFLSSPPTHCNAANVVASLTFSAKALGTREIKQDDELRRMLLKTLKVLHDMVHDRGLNARQLCNACWAIAKHYDRDATILPPPPDKTALSSETSLGTAETWNMDEMNSKESSEQWMVSATLDEIALQITGLLEAPSLLKNETVKVGEICMATWAFGKLQRRNTPPGWLLPPQLGKLESSADDATMKSSNSIIFEQWSSFGSKYENVDNNNINNDSNDHKEKLDDAIHGDITSRLFNAIATALTRIPEAPGMIEGEGGVGGVTAVRQETLSGLDQCAWNELANVAWSFASHGFCKSRQAENLLSNIAREAKYRLYEGGETVEGFEIRDIAQLIWALGTLQADNFYLLDDVVGLVEALSSHLRLNEKVSTFTQRRPLLKWTCADIVQVSIALAHSRIDELPLLKALYSESVHRLMEGTHGDNVASSQRFTFCNWEVSVLLWAAARLHLTEEQGYEFKDFVEDAPGFFLASLDRSGGDFSSIGIGQQEQANIVWALTVLEAHETPEAIDVIDKIFTEAATTLQEDQSIQLEHAHQLYQGLFLLEEESPAAVRNVPEWFSDYLNDKWILEKAKDKISSARHRAISETLNLMGVDHYNEHDEDIDVAIILKEHASWTHQTEVGGNGPIESVSVAVEFDGPYHFTHEKEATGEKPRALGHTVLKYRLLKKQGWTVVRVPYFEFDKIPFWSSMERQRYLQRKLKTHAAIRFSERDVSEYKSPTGEKHSRYD